MALRVRVINNDNDPWLTGAIIDCSGTSNTLITGATGKMTSVYRMFFVSSAATTVTFKQGTTALTGAITVSAGGAFALDFDGEPWFETAASANFVVTQSGTAQISGRIYYVQAA